MSSEPDIKMHGQWDSVFEPGRLVVSFSQEYAEKLVSGELGQVWPGDIKVALKHLLLEYED